MATRLSLEPDGILKALLSREPPTYSLALEASGPSSKNSFPIHLSRRNILDLHPFVTARPRPAAPSAAPQGCALARGGASRCPLAAPPCRGLPRAGGFDAWIGA